MYEIRHIFVEPKYFDPDALEHLTEGAFKALEIYLERMVTSCSYDAKVRSFFNEYPRKHKHWSEYPFEKFPIAVSTKMGIFMNLTKVLSTKEADKLKKFIPIFLLDYYLKDLNDGQALIQVRVLKNQNQQVPVHPYLDGKTFLKETVELADNYVTTLVNESDAFRLYSDLNKANQFKLDATLPYTIPATSREYNSILRKVDIQDRQKFALLCRLVIWNYYAEQFGLIHTVIPIKHWSETLEMYDPFKDPNWEPSVSVNHSIKPLGTISVTQLAAEFIKVTEEEQLQLAEKVMNNNTLEKYKDVVVKEVTLIHGKPTEDYTESELIALIRGARAEQESIKDLISDSKRMRTRAETLATNISVYTTALDALKD